MKDRSSILAAIMFTLLLLAGLTMITVAIVGVMDAPGIELNQA